MDHSNCKFNIHSWQSVDWCDNTVLNIVAIFLYFDSVRAFLAMSFYQIKSINQLTLIFRLICNWEIILRDIFNINGNHSTIQRVNLPLDLDKSSFSHIPYVLNSILKWNIKSSKMEMYCLDVSFAVALSTLEWTNYSTPRVCTESCILILCHHLSLSSSLSPSLFLSLSLTFLFILFEYIQQ